MSQENLECLYLFLSLMAPCVIFAAIVFVILYLDLDKEISKDKYSDLLREIKDLNCSVQDMQEIFKGVNKQGIITHRDRERILRNIEKVKLSKNRQTVISMANFAK